MSYAQAVKHSRNHHRQRVGQPIVLGFTVNTPTVCNHPLPVPHYANMEDTQPDYFMCLRCGTRGITSKNRKGK